MIKYTNVTFAKRITMTTEQPTNDTMAQWRQW